MPLSGKAAMLLTFDIVAEEIPEHDDWHTHEHLPERLSIPGFRRGTRWVALRGEPRYFVMYEVEELAVLASQAYLTRLNNPSAWTQKIMPHYRGMTRGLCSVTASLGLGMGHVALLIRFKPKSGAEPALRDWLVRDRLATLPAMRGIGSVHLFERGATAAMTNEQRIRGADAGVDWAFLVTGYGAEALEHLAEGDLGGARLEAQGATGILAARYRLDYALTDRECLRG